MRTLSLYRHPYGNRFDVESAFDALDREFFGARSPLAEVGRYMDRFLCGEGAANAVRVPSCNVEETGDNFLLDVELPGFTMEDIAVNLDNGVLTIESVKKENADCADDADCGKKNFVLRERRSCAFARSFKLPDSADAEAISASFKNGLLSVKIGKKTETQKKTIQIEG